MKKALYGTTALIAAGALMASPASAAEKIKLGLSGYWQTVASFTDQDEPAGVDWHPNAIRQEGEVHFTGSTTLDNGITFGVNIQLEGKTQGDVIDESFAIIEGSFGRALIGSENSAPYLMGYTAPSVSLGVNSPNIFLFESRGTTAGGLGGAGTATVMDVDTSDANKLTYFTPRFSGFQLGVSYTPNIDARGGDRQSSGLSVDDQHGDFSDFIGIGVNYVQTIDNIDIAVSGGYVLGQSEEDGPVGTDLTEFEDLQEFGFGVNVGFAGFTVGGSWHTSNNGLDNVDNDTDAWDVGASYETGPWGVSVTYLHSNTEWGSFDDTEDHFEVGMSYAMGPGVKLVGSVQYFDEENEVASAAAGSDQDTDGVAFAIGSMLSF